VDVVALFSEILERVDGYVHTGDPVTAIDEIVARYGVGPFLSWDPDSLPVTGAVTHLENLGCVRVDAEVPGEPDARKAHQAGYTDVHIGLTGADAAFAETGSIVVRSGPGKPRMASLVPLIHIAFLPVEKIFRSPMHWLTRFGTEIEGDANVVYITGPSRTADIEQQLNLGVHGPRELHVVLV
jgi:L-lactate dehydrogenase complex protein LldG